MLHVYSMFQGPTNASVLEMETQSVSSKFDMVFCCNVNTLCVSKVFSVSSPFRSLIPYGRQGRSIWSSRVGPDLGASPSASAKSRMWRTWTESWKHEGEEIDTEVDSRAKSILFLWKKEAHMKRNSFQWTKFLVESEAFIGELQVGAECPEKSQSTMTMNSKRIAKTLIVNVIDCNL